MGRGQSRSVAMASRTRVVYNRSGIVYKLYKVVGK